MNAAALAVTMALSACGTVPTLSSLAPPSEQQFARGVLAQIRHRQLESVERILNPAIPRSQARAEMQKMAAALPIEDPVGVQLIAANANTFNNEPTTLTLTFEYEFATVWAIGSVTSHAEDGRRAVDALHVERIPDSLRHLNAFTFRGKGARHYAVLAAAVLIPLFIVAVFIIALRTPVPRRKWAWLLFIAIGVGQLTFNWTNGAWQLQLARVVLLGGGFVKSSLGPGPLFLMVGFPLGALVFLWRRRTWIGQRPAEGADRLPAEMPQTTPDLS